jgi:hypothetical protein
LKSFNPYIVIIFWLLLSRMSLISVLCAQVTIEPGSYITIKEGGSLMIGTNLHIKSNANSSGYFVDKTIDGDVKITGNIAVERYMTAEMWHNVASPVSNETVSCFTGTDLVFWYNETLILNDWNFGWVWDTIGPLTVFRGYDVYFDGSPVLVTYHATGTQKLNTGAYSITVTSTLSDPTETAPHKGWNLVGNPYPSPVDWLATGWNKSSIHDVKYIWDGIHDIYTIFVGGGSPIGINGGTRFIPSNQGFWVQATQTGSFGIQNSVRLGDITGTPDYYKIKPVDYPLVSLVTSGNNKSDEVVIRFIEGTTEGFDLNYDASKLFSPVETVPQLSIQSGNQVMALNTLPQITDNLEVQLDFLCGKSGYYTISLSQRTNLDPAIKVFLKDERARKLVNLTQNPVYEFYHEPANNKNRFKIFFNPSDELLDDISSDTYFFVFAEKNTITVMRNMEVKLPAEMTVYNMLGQALCTETLGFSDKSSFPVSFPTGYYIVSIRSARHSSNFKILITD